MYFGPPSAKKGPEFRPTATHCS